MENIRPDLEQQEDDIFPLEQESPQPEEAVAEQTEEDSRQETTL